MWGSEGALRKREKEMGAPYSAVNDMFTALVTVSFPSQLLTVIFQRAVHNMSVGEVLR